MTVPQLLNLKKNLWSQSRVFTVLFLMVIGKTSAFQVLSKKLEEMGTDWFSHESGAERRPAAPLWSRGCFMSLLVGSGQKRLHLEHSKSTPTPLLWGHALPGKILQQSMNHSVSEAALHEHDSSTVQRFSRVMCWWRWSAGILWAVQESVRINGFIKNVELGANPCV